MSIATSELLDFGSDSTFRRQLQPAGARLHPGKLHLGFLAWLLTRYTQPGQTLLDPMAGSGSLLMATLPPWRCDVVLNELEPQWVGELCAAWLHLQGSIVPPVGTATLVAGDARTLARRLPLVQAWTALERRVDTVVDVICTSPPYDDALHCWATGPALQRLWGDPADPYTASRGYNPDVVITSPPYEDALSQTPGQTLRALYADERTNQGNTSLLRCASYDAVLTSPPYDNSLAAAPGSDSHPERVTDRRSSMAAVSAQYQAGYDAVVTSPPYADALSPQRHSDDYTPYRQAGHRRAEDGPDRSLIAQRRGYDPDARGKRTANPAQIGNLGGRRYQAAMAEVYAQCVALVRPGGLVIVILKNVVRDNAELDLVSQAADQLTALGLREVATHWRKVRTGPFHAIRRKHNPQALIIDREAALVYQAPRLEDRV